LIVAVVIPPLAGCRAPGLNTAHRRHIGRQNATHHRKKTMEIRDKQSTGGLLPYLNPLNDARSEGKPARLLPEIIDEDKVILSPGAREVREALLRVADEPDIRSEKVSALRDQIESGVYHFDGRKIALKMISEHLIDQVL
jgi:flagellar biosynthesis anti-sigma factor FlgM